jgi:lipoyl-dependent peroxiredoxin
VAVLTARIVPGRRPGVQWGIQPGVKILYTATATADDGGRNGRTRTDDGALDLKLTTPESMGGPGGEGTNPEQLFAAGYAGCFANAMRSIARRDRREEVVEGATVTTHVGIGRIPDGRFGLAVRLEVAVPALGQEEAEALVERAHARCPYSNAIRGNVEVEMAVAAGTP